jgi:hypothetical protein
VTDVALPFNVPLQLEATLIYSQWQAHPAHIFHKMLIGQPWRDSKMLLKSVSNSKIPFKSISMMIKAWM